MRLKVEVGQQFIFKDLKGEIYTVTSVPSYPGMITCQKSSSNSRSVFCSLVDDNIIELGSAWHLVKHDTFHAHIYQNAHEKNVCLQIRDSLLQLREAEINKPNSLQLLAMEVGKFHAQAVGPHPIPMFQVLFDSRDFTFIVDYLSQNRRGQSILIHPMTSDPIKDHTDHAIWMGKPINLNLKALQSED